MEPLALQNVCYLFINWFNLDCLPIKQLSQYNMTIQKIWVYLGSYFEIFFK